VAVLHSNEVASKGYRSAPACPEPAVNQVVEEDQLGRTGEQRSDGDKPMHRNKRLQEVIHK